MVSFFWCVYALILCVVCAAELCGVTPDTPPGGMYAQTRMHTTCTHAHAYMHTHTHFCMLIHTQLFTNAHAHIYLHHAHTNKHRHNYTIFTLNMRHL